MSFDKTNSKAMANSCENKSEHLAQFANGYNLNFTCPSSLNVSGATVLSAGVTLSSTLNVANDISAMSNLYIKGNARLGDAITDTLSFYGVNATAQQAAITNLAIGNLSGSTNGTDQSTNINNGFNDVETKVNAILAVLRNLGFIAN